MVYIGNRWPYSFLEACIVFDWDEHNIAHIDRHGVRLMEAEDAFLDPRRLV